MNIYDVFLALVDRVKLPAGFHIKIDSRTDNILIHDADVGFAVTSLYCRDHDIDSIVENVKGVLTDVAAYKGTQRTSDLLNPSAETKFDAVSTAWIDARPRLKTEGEPIRGSLAEPGVD